MVVAVAPAAPVLEVAFGRNAKKSEKHRFWNLMGASLLNSSSQGCAN